jgi:membrane protein involved in colicin uptake
MINNTKSGLSKMALVLFTAGLLTQTNAVQVEVKSLAETATGEHLNLD